MRDYIRYILRWAMTPFVIVLSFLYKKYQKYIRKRSIQVKYQDILDGYSYLVVKDSAIEEMAQHRASICSKCTQAKYSGTVNTIVVDNKIKEIKGLRCAVCACPISGIVRAEEKVCPLGKW
jgi:hypothetical protein